MNRSISQSKAEYGLAIALVAIAVGSRLVCNALGVYNFNAVGASAIFAGACMQRSKWGYLIPFVAMLLSDLVIGFYDIQQMAVVYGSYAVMLAIGLLYSRKPSLLRFVEVSLGGSLAFFLISNFALWPFYTQYPHTLSGIMDSYSMALPFYKHSFESDMLFSGILFAGYEMAKVHIGKLIPVKA